MVSTHLAGGSNPSGGTLPAVGCARQSSATQRCHAPGISDSRDARSRSAAPLIMFVVVMVVMVVVIVMVVVVVVFVMVIVVVFFGS